jgi:hypothetical protein
MRRADGLDGVTSFVTADAHRLVEAAAQAGLLWYTQQGLDECVMLVDRQRVLTFDTIEIQAQSRAK